MKVGDTTLITIAAMVTTTDLVVEAMNAIDTKDMSSLSTSKTPQGPSRSLLATPITEATNSEAGLEAEAEKSADGLREIETRGTTGLVIITENSRLSLRGAAYSLMWKTQVSSIGSCISL
jgi:hypothetical protein